MEKLVYSIVSANQSEDLLKKALEKTAGITGSRLYSVTRGQIGVVFSDIERSGFSATQDTALEYAGVIEELSGEFNLLPVRFGSLMESTDSISSMIEKNYPAIIENLSKVENKLEFGLKVFCVTESIRELFREKAENQPSGSTNQGEPSVYMDYVRKKLKEHRFEEMILAHVNNVGREITDHLALLNPLHKFKKMPSSSNLIDAVFLLEKTKTESIVEVVKQLQVRYPGFRFVLTGPRPPYSFVDITLK